MLNGKRLVIWTPRLKVPRRLNPGGASPSTDKRDQAGGYEDDGAGLRDACVVLHAEGRPLIERNAARR